MTPELVDHAHTDSCAVIGCNLVQPRRKMNMFISGCGWLGSRVVSVLDSGDEGPGSNRSRDAVG